MTAEATETPPRNRHVCPWWIGYLLASPIRKLGENPGSILGPLVEPGMTVVDVGCAMGFFSLPLAQLVGCDGRVVCVDVQQRMLSTLDRRARRKGLDNVIETRLATQESLGLGDLEGQADVVVAFHVIHEASFPELFLEQCRSTLRPGGRLLIAEPQGHVTPEEFQASRTMALDLGLDVCDAPSLRRSLTMLLERSGRKPPAKR